MRTGDVVMAAEGYGTGAARQPATIAISMTTLLLLVAVALAATPPVEEMAHAGEPVQEEAKLREPLPLDVAVWLRSHNGRSPINLSPDGEWVAHTIGTDDTVPRGVSSSYSAAGFPFAEGDSRMEATLSHTRTGETIRLGGAASSSWAGTWSPDGQRLLVKVLPADMTVAQANALSVRPSDARRFAEVRPGATVGHRAPLGGARCRPRGSGERPGPGRVDAVARRS